jgi:hypothetical protein
MNRRGLLGSIMAARLASSPTCAVGDSTQSGPESIRGRARLVSRLLAERSIPADAGPIERQVAIVDDAGTASLLVSDEASRALFLDDALRDRKGEFRIRRFAGLPFIQVVGFRVEHEGRLATPEYHCDICSIDVRYPQICPCCQGSMELRYQHDSADSSNP